MAVRHLHQDKALLVETEGLILLVAVEVRVRLDRLHQIPLVVMEEMDYLTLTLVQQLLMLVVAVAQPIHKHQVTVAQAVVG